MPHFTKGTFNLGLKYTLQHETEVVEDLVEKELAAHNKPNIQVSKTLHLYTQ